MVFLSHRAQSRVSLAWLQPVNEKLFFSIFAFIQQSIRATSQVLECGESKDKGREEDNGRRTCNVQFYCSTETTIQTIYQTQQAIRGYLNT